MMARPDVVSRFADWTVRRALPFWAECGRDRARGRFHERLDFAGQPIAVPRRMMVQARQIYVYAHAAVVGWHVDGAAIAMEALHRLVRDYGTILAGRASFAFSIHEDGRIADDARDAYAHAFLLFALAWCHRATGDPAVLVLADQVAAFVTEALTDEGGGAIDAPQAPGERRQNPTMHLLEAFLALARTAPARGFLDRAATLVALFRRALFDEQAGVVHELFDGVWLPTDRRFEPGHQFEWAWLLAEYQALSGEDMTPWIARLHSMAAGHGVDISGRVLERVGHDLRPDCATFRLWPHCEAVKSAIVHGDAALLERSCAALTGRFLDRPFAGGWIDRIDAEGRPMLDHVPASSLYHLMFAATEAARAGGLCQVRENMV